MDQQNSMNENANKNIHINFDDFNINEDSFKPVTKGLGFHHEQKRTNTFKSTPKEVTLPKPMKASSGLLNEISKPNKEVTNNAIPTGLEAFYGAKPQMPTISENEAKKVIDSKIFEEEKKIVKASSASQFFAWIIDVAIVLSFATITTVLLILVSGMTFQAFMKVVAVTDLAIFGAVLFSLYYLMYFTILDLSATPGKTIFGIRLVRLDNRNVSVKHTFIRSLVSLLSFIAIFLPNLIDFQGRLSDTKAVKQ